MELSGIFRLWPPIFREGQFRHCIKNAEESGGQSEVPACDRKTFDIRSAWQPLRLACHKRKTTTGGPDNQWICNRWFPPGHQFLWRLRQDAYSIRQQHWKWIRDQRAFWPAFRSGIPENGGLSGQGQQVQINRRGDQSPIRKVSGIFRRTCQPMWRQAMPRDEVPAHYPESPWHLNTW